MQALCGQWLRTDSLQGVLKGPAEELCSDVITSSYKPCLSRPPLSDSLPKTLRSRRKQRLVFSVTLSVMEKDANHKKRSRVLIHPLYRAGSWI